MNSFSWIEIVKVLSCLVLKSVYSFMNVIWFISIETYLDFDLRVSISWRKEGTIDEFLCEEHAMCWEFNIWRGFLKFIAVIIWVSVCWRQVGRHSCFLWVGSSCFYSFKWFVLINVLLFNQSMKINSHWRFLLLYFYTSVKIRSFLQFKSENFACFEYNFKVNFRNDFWHSCLNFKELSIRFLKLVFNLVLNVSLN